MVQQRLIGRIAIAVAARFENFNRGTRQAARGTRLTSREIARLRREARQTSAELRGMSQRLRGLGTIAAGAFAGFGIAEVTRGALAFDRELTKINTLVGVSRRQLEGWRDDIINIARESAILPQELSQGLFNIVSVGLEGREALEALRVIANATATGLGEFGQVADAVTRIFGAFRSTGITASESADVLFQSLQQGNDTADQFVQAFSRLSKQAANAGVAANDLGAALAFMTRSGFRARLAATGLGQVFAAIIRPSKEAQAAIAEIGLGIEEYRELFSGGRLVEGLVELNELANARGVPLTQFLPDKEAINTALTFIREAGDARGVFGRFEREVAGAAERARRNLQESPEFQIRQALTAINIQFQNLAAETLPALARNFDNIASVTTSLLFAFGLLLPALRSLGLFLRRRTLTRQIDEATMQTTQAARTGVTATPTGQIALENASRQTAAAVGEAARAGTEFRNSLIGLGVGAAAVADSFVGLGGVIRRAVEGAQADTGIDTSEFSPNTQIESLQAQLRGVNAAIRARFDRLGDAPTPEEFDRFESAYALLTARAQVLRDELARLRASLDPLGAAFLNTTEGQERFAAGTEEVLEQIRARADAEEIQVNLEFEPILPRERLQGILDNLRERVEDASLTFQLEGATPFQSEIATRSLELQRQVAENILGIEERREEVNKRISDEKEKGNSADFILIAQQEDLLASLAIEERRLRDALDINTEIGGQIYDQFLILGNIAQARQDNADSLEQEREAQEALVRNAANLARQEQAIYSARLVGQRAGQDLLLQARQELELARLTNRLRGNPIEQINAEITALTARQAIETQRLGLQRRIADAQEALARAERQGSEEAIEAANNRLLVLEAERDGLGSLNEAWIRYAEIQRQIAEESAVDELAESFNSAFESMRQSLGSFLVDLAKGVGDFRSLVDQLVSSLLGAAIDVLSQQLFTGALFSLFGGGFNPASLLGTSDFQGLHRGGLARTGLAVVGEAGPELVDFRRPGRVYTNEELGGALRGGGGPVFNYAPVIQTSDGAAVRREIQRHTPEFVALARNVVSSDMGDRASRMRQSLAG